MATRAAAAAELTRLLRTPFLRALAEPARLDVLEVMLSHGAGDVASIAAHLPQDRSVISRHLKALEEAGVVRSTRDGRHRRYELDGGGFVKGFEALAGKVRSLASVCCPPGSEPPAKARRKK